MENIKGDLAERDISNTKLNNAITTQKSDNNTAKTNNYSGNLNDDDIKTQQNTFTKNQKSNEQAAKKAADENG